MLLLVRPYQISIEGEFENLEFNLTNENKYKKNIQLKEWNACYFFRNKMAFFILLNKTKQYWPCQMVIFMVIC